MDAGSSNGIKPKGRNSEKSKEAELSVHLTIKE